MLIEKIFEPIFDFNKIAGSVVTKIGVMFLKLIEWNDSNWGNAGDTQSIKTGESNHIILVQVKIDCDNVQITSPTRAAVLKKYKH